MTIHYQGHGVTVHAGDCLDVLAGMGDATVDSVVTDPPYNLSDSGKRDGDCLRRIIAEGALPQLHSTDAESVEGRDLPRPTRCGAKLSRKDWTIGVERRVGVPEGSLDLQGSPVIQHEVNTSDEPPTLTTNRVLPDVADTERVEHQGDFILQLADGGNSAFCDTTCSCFTEPSAGVIAVTVALPCAATGDLAGDLLGSPRASDTDVGLRDFPCCESKAATGIVADTGTVRRAVLRLDLARRTGELVAADGAHERSPLFLLLPTEPVRTRAGAGGLAAVAKPADVSLVGDRADRTLSLHMPWHALKSSRTTGGFMGKAWDGWDSPASFQRWCKAWAVECLRVLRPGGHLLAFGGTRTFHRLACAIEDAGFEIRDSIGHGSGGGVATEADSPGLLAWVYGSGFP